jgi:hypothetical protein
MTAWTKQRQTSSTCELHGRHRGLEGRAATRSQDDITELSRRTLSGSEVGLGRKRPLGVGGLEFAAGDGSGFDGEP